MDIVNHGQIASLSLPDNWAEDDNVKRVDIGSRSARKFRPKDQSDVEFCLFYRGFPVKAESAAAFVEVLDKPPHLLMPAEIKALSVVLGKRADSDSFSILSLRSEDLNGKRVLVLEGRYKEQANDIYEILINADGAGEVVQELFLLAPKNKYLLHLGEIRSALKSIKWKQGNKIAT